MSRPSLKKPELIETFLDRIMEGKSMREICKADDMPTFQTICRWLRDDAEFSEQYTRARAIQADVIVEDIIPLADKATGKNDADAIRVRVQARQWAASKLSPKKYGEKLDLSGSLTHKVDKIVIEYVDGVSPEGQ